MNQISPKVQNQLAMLQQIQQQMQNVMAQKTQYEMALREAKRAVEELADVPEDGNVYMKKKEHVILNLTEKQETLDLRIKSLEKQEKMLQGKFEQLQAQIKQAIEGPGTPSAA
jgi:prefoldin beta subunit